MKSRLLRAAPLALCLALGQPAQSQPAAEQTAALTSGQWREDLAFMIAEMKRRHPNLHHSVSRERFDAAVADLHARIPSLQRNEIIVGLMRLAAMVGDGHTRVDPRKDPRFAFPSLPLKLYLFDDGLFIRAAAPGHAELVGAEILAIGGIPIDEAVRRTSEISSSDNAMSRLKFASLYLNMPDILHALKLSRSRDAAVLKLRKGKRVWTVAVPAGQIDPVWPPDTDISLITPEGWVDARTTAQPPLWLQDPLDYHRMVELAESRTIYARLSMVDNEEGQTLAEFGKAIAERAKAANPRAIVLDMRLAHGGNGSLRHGFIRELIRAEDEDTRLLVLTWRGTYSASQFILDDLDRISRAHFLGEPASSKPSSYGDSYRTPLPNSGISVRTSIKWWQDGQNFAPWTYMDVSVPLRFADYAAGRDPVLDVAVSYEPPERLYDLVLKARTDREVMQVIDAFVARRANLYANLQLQMIGAAEQLFAAKRTDAALAVAGLAGRRFPRSVGAQLVLGVIAERAGNLDLAATAGRQALAIDPNDREARALLERIKSKRGAKPG